ncbi:MAG: tRNA uridine-5-carboxymethylaminomethyl(34) synthesis GTPase MnmE [Pseudomonadota bacterium]
MKSKRLPNFEKGLDTIAAIATPSGRGGIGIIRISGSHTQAIAVALIGRLPKPRHADYLKFLAIDGTPIDKGVVLYFPAPNSFTGEDVLEIQGHGGPIILDCLLQRVLQLGARLARPGEFSERAFLNGKLDLVQAEAIADLIDAESAQAALAAMRSLQGEFSKHVNRMLETLIALRMYLEASIDFSDETIDFLKDSDAKKKLKAILLEIAKIKKVARQGVLLQEGMHIAIVGPPNVGKSSLLNKLTGQDSAIVTPVAGTTRDVIREKIHIDGLPIHIVDTAGLRKIEDEVEQQGIKRSLAEIEKADRILWVVDSTITPLSDLKSLYLMDFFDNLSLNKRVTVIRNKIDINQESAHFSEEANFDVISLSVKTGEGLSILHHYLKTSVGYEAGAEGNFSARRRHLEALDKAETALTNGLDKLGCVDNQFPELLAEDLAIAQNHLNTITGQFTTEDLLGKIFSSFCIGK